MSQVDTAAGRYTLFGDARSGNCYKPAQLLAFTDRPFDWVSVDVMSGNTQSEAFLALNPNGKVPLLQLPDGRLLAESNAMLLHLAEGTPYLPEDAYERAIVYQWLFFEQYSHEPYIAVRRFLKHFDHGTEVPRERLNELLERGNAALQLMNETLQHSAFFAGQHYTIADTALFAYTHVAEDGGFTLSHYPAVQSWLQRCGEVDGHMNLAAVGQIPAKPWGTRA